MKGNSKTKIEHESRLLFIFNKLLIINRAFPLTVHYYSIMTFIAKLMRSAPRGFIMETSHLGAALLQHISVNVLNVFQSFISLHLVNVFVEEIILTILLIVLRN